MKFSSREIDSKALVYNERFVRLETTPECLIGEIIEARLYKGRIYILEQTGSEKRILVFDASGAFLFPLGTYGRGPGEIYNPGTFCFCDSSIFVWDTSVHEFTLDNQYVRKLFGYFVQGSKMEEHDGRFVIFHGPDPQAYVSVVDFAGNVLDTFKLDYLRYNMGGAQSDAIMVPTKGALTFFNFFIEEIYSLQNGQFGLAYRFRFHDMQGIRSILPISEVSPYEIMKTINAAKYCHIINYFENSEIIFCTNSYDNRRFYTLLDKRRWASHSLGKLLHGPLNMDVSPEFMLDSTTFCKVLETYNLMEKGEAVLSRIPQLHPLIKGSKIDDNPILYLYNFKRFEK